MRFYRKEARANSEDGLCPVACNYVAYVYCALSDVDRYSENLNSALEEHVKIVVYVMCSPSWRRRGGLQVRGADGETERNERAVEVMSPRGLLSNE